MSPSPGEREPLSELFHRLTGLLREVVPPEAQVHLFNAQRELLAALAIMYENQAGPRRPGGRGGRRRPPREGLRQIKVE